MLQLRDVPGLDRVMDASAVRDTIASVFTHPGYQVSLQQSLGDRLLQWLGRWLMAILEAIGGLVDIRWLAIGIAAAALALVLLRSVYLASGEMKRLRRREAASVAPAFDPWQRAQEEAAAGRYMSAAHLLYPAVMVSLAASEGIALHPAKTAGEYRRELRARGSGATAPFALFARAYEEAVWRGGTCDRSCFTRLAQLAEGVVMAGGQRAAA